jgi:hypothetical protein
VPEARDPMMEIFERMEVVDADNQYVGVVQKVGEDRVELVKGTALDPRHPTIRNNRVAAVEHNKVKLAQKISAITTRAFVSPDQREE